MAFLFDNNLPIYIQLVEQLKIHIIAGDISPGEKLPSVRELALMTKVNPNTMQKALAELEELNLIYTERTTGKYVTKNEKTIKAFKEEYALSLKKQYFENMKAIGFTDEEALVYINKIGEKKHGTTGM